MTKSKTIFSLIKSVIFLPLFLYFLAAEVNLSYAAAQDFLRRDDNIQHNYEVLNASAKELQASGRPKASVGTILYTYDHKMEPYLLIGQENHTKKGASSYCELGGGVELDQSGKAETFLNACIREAKEESAGVYKLDPKYVLLNSYAYYNVTPKGREEVYIFLKAPYYSTASDILAAVEREVDPQYREKINFKWVKLSDLRSCAKEQCEVRDLEGKKEIINLRDFFFKTLQSPKVQDIFKEIEKSGSQSKS